MKVILLGLSIAILIISQPVQAAEPKAYCDKLVMIFDTALSKIVKGDYSNRVLIALAAHKRLECPADQLLKVLRIEDRKKTK